MVRCKDCQHWLRDRHPEPTLGDCERIMGIARTPPYTGGAFTYPLTPECMHPVRIATGADFGCVHGERIPPPPPKCRLCDNPKPHGHYCAESGALVYSAWEGRPTPTPPPKRLLDPDTYEGLRTSDLWEAQGVGIDDFAWHVLREGPCDFCYYGNMGTCRKCGARVHAIWNEDVGDETLLACWCEGCGPTCAADAGL